MSIETLAFPLRRDLPSVQRVTTRDFEATLRHAETADMPYLRDLYAASRAAELAGIAWPEEVKRAFLDSQFDMQHRHYTANYASADFLMVIRNEQPCGRLYLHESSTELCIVDILLDDAVRGHGLGTALLHWMQTSVKQKGLHAIQLHVDLRNEAAHRLYRRLGFIDGDIHGAHQRMSWHH
ncbi:N-acetyltransferase family protein [Dyella sp. 20L07]|uniref:GNAT family N-acetyltransferase n=1 Tax=Dyella sp. 20L07 TaxID=3384240 RepID=UPI003D283048